MGCRSVTLIPTQDVFLKGFMIEIRHLGYIWWSIDEAQSFFLKLSCDNQSIRNIQNDYKSPNLQTEIRVTVVEFPPDTIFTSLNTSLTVDLGGYFGQLLKIFKMQYNISFTIFPSKSNQFGVLINGSWTGMIGDLTRGSAGIATGVSMTSQREDYVRFSPSIYLKQYDIIYRQLDQYEWNYDFYLQPCKMEVWLCIFAISLTVILLKVVANYVSRNKNFACILLHSSEQLLLCWPIVLQGNLNGVSFKSLKLVFGIYIAFSMSVLMSYTSILTSLFAIPDTKVPFNSLEDMYVKTNFLPVILKGGVLEEIFLKPPYENKSVLRVNTLIEGIESVYRGKFGLVQSLQAVQHLIGSNCSFAVAPRYVKKESVAFAYSKQFAYIDYFDSKILLLKQSGILSVEFKRFYPDQQKCSESLFNTVSFGQIIGPFLFIMSAIIISLIFGILELIINKCKT
uniref:Uncharacterized protein n=1 Tax=Strigamia maritima TaxID=126957 RepID=T1JM75_STRMM